MLQLLLFAGAGALPVTTPITITETLATLYPSFAYRA
jgi:hypothetical protein